MGYSDKWSSRQLTKIDQIAHLSRSGLACEIPDRFLSFRRENEPSYVLSTSSTAALIVSGAFSQSPESPASPEQGQRTTSEELVTAHTEANLKQAGLVFSPSPEPPK